MVAAAISALLAGGHIGIPSPFAPTIPSWRAAIVVIIPVPMAGIVVTSMLAPFTVVAPIAIATLAPPFTIAVMMLTTPVPALAVAVVTVAVMIASKRYRRQRQAHPQYQAPLVKALHYPPPSEPAPLTPDHEDPLSKARLNPEGKYLPYTYLLVQKRGPTKVKR